MTKKSPIKKSPIKKSPIKKSPRKKSPRKKSPRKKSHRKKLKMDIHYDNNYIYNKENEEKIKNLFEKSARKEYKKQSNNYYYTYGYYPYSTNEEIDKYININSINIKKIPNIDLKEAIENLIDESPREKRRYDLEEGISKRERDNKNGHNLRRDYDDYNF